MKILYQEPYMVYKPWINVPIILFLLLLTIGMFVLGAYLLEEEKTYIGIFTLVSSSVFLCVWLIVVVTPVPIEKQYYACITNPDYSIEKMNEEYEIIEQKGELFILKDKRR